MKSGCFTAILLTLIAAVSHERRTLHMSITEMMYNTGGLRPDTCMIKAGFMEHVAGRLYK